MFLVTNREILAESGGTEILGKKPNVMGPHELRIVQAEKRSGKWRLEVLPDTADEAMMQETAKVRKAVTVPVLDEDGNQVVDNHIATYVAHKILDTVNPQLASPRSTRKGRNLLFFVHGFNNDVEDVLERSRTLERLYRVEVLAFTWPANGGGLISGTASYKSDKRDAKASIGALDRTLLHMARCLNAVTEQRAEKIRLDAAARYPDNHEDRDALVARALDRGCPFTVNFMAHSMGNYLYKNLLQSTASEGNVMLFDNVLLVAADTNNLDHERWVDKIKCRRRVYITLNEDDKALQVSRMKSGEEQLARLGHYPFNLDARYAAYVQFTDAKHVGRSHAYFADAVENPKVKKFFKLSLNGERADATLRYDPASNTYRI